MISEISLSKKSIALVLATKNKETKRHTPETQKSL